MKRPRRVVFSGSLALSSAGASGSALTRRQYIMPAVVMQWLELPAVKWAIPLPVLAVVAPLVWVVFRGTWRELDVKALAARQALAARGAVDYRPALALTLVALVLTM